MKENERTIERNKQKQAAVRVTRLFTFKTQKLQVSNIAALTSFHSDSQNALMSKIATGSLDDANSRRFSEWFGELFGLLLIRQVTFRQ